MDGNDRDREAIDVLIRDLMTKRLASAKAAAAHSVATPTEKRPGTRWSNVRLLMPAPRSVPGLGRRLAFASALALPHLPDFSRFFRVPGPVTIVRMWVGLGVVYGTAMAFWPYPKTYLWGLVLYLLSLGLVLAAGIWGARLSWQERLGAAHTIALATVLWALVLAAAEIPPLT